jgi:putative flavoprotein involved in K+ transport
MVKDEIVRYIEDYVRFFDPPLIEGVSVTALARRSRGRLRVSTSAGDCHADQVVIATGGYHTPAIPRLSASACPSA